MHIAEPEAAPPQQSSAKALKSREQLMTELRTLIPVLGVREAARQLGMSEDTAKTWSSRYGFTSHPAVQQAIANVPRGVPLTLKPIETNGGQILAQNMLEDAVQSRASGLRLTRRTLSRFERLDDDELIQPEVIDGVQKTIKSASVVGGYAANSRPDQVAVSFGGRETGLVIDATPIEEEPVSDSDTPSAV